MTGELFREQAPHSQPLATVPGDRHLVDEPSDATTDGSANCEIIPDRVTDCRQRRQWLQVNESNPERVVGLCQRIHGRRPAPVVEVDHRSHCLELSLGQLTHVARRRASRAPVREMPRASAYIGAAQRSAISPAVAKGPARSNGLDPWLLRCVIQRGTDYDCAFFGTRQETNQGGGFLEGNEFTAQQFADLLQTVLEPAELSHRSAVRAAYD
jgi:hypothetical protein